MLDPEFGPQFAITFECNMYGICDYCYIKEFAKKFESRHMSVPDFEFMIKILKELGAKRVTFIGGEPTIHPNLDEIIKVMERYGIRCRMFTNGMYPDRIAEMTGESEAVEEIAFHYDPEYLRKGGKERFLKNLESAHKHGKKIILRYNILKPDFDYSQAIRLSVRFGNAPIAYSINVPAPGVPEVRIMKLPEYVPKLRRFVEECRKRKIKLLLARPLPYCMFEPEDIEFFRKYAGFQATCSPIDDLTINPDRSLQLCSVTFEVKEGKVRDSGDFLEKMESLKKKAEEIRWKPSTEECMDCAHFRNRECQGGCLGYKFY